MECCKRKLSARKCYCEEKKKLLFIRAYWRQFYFTTVILAIHAYQLVIINIKCSVHFVLQSTNHLNRIWECSFIRMQFMNFEVLHARTSWLPVQINIQIKLYYGNIYITKYETCKFANLNKYFCWFGNMYHIYAFIYLGWVFCGQ